MASNHQLRPPLVEWFAARPVGLLVGLTVTGWLAAMLWPNLLRTLGILGYGNTQFLDSYAVLAAVDAVRAGANPHGPNALDPLMRSHVYSDWWLALRWLGLTRAHNFLVGLTWITGFALTVWVTARPRQICETFWLAALLLSPPFFLAVERANNDLVIFILLAGCGWAVSSPARWPQWVALGCLGLATGLKYFPAAAALGFLWVRPVRRMPAMFLAALVVVALALVSVWPDINRSRFIIPSTVHAMGAPLWWREFGWADSASALPSLLLIVGAALSLALARVTVGLLTQGSPTERLRAALGAIVLLTCFISGVNYAYRWIFIIWPAIWLWRQAIDPALTIRARWVARVACALILLCLWLDGLLCLLINQGFLIMTPMQVDQLDSIWRRSTQPLPWLLMMLFAGWLLEAGLTTVKEWWGLRHEP